MGEAFWGVVASVLIGMSLAALWFGGIYLSVVTFRGGN